MTHPCKVGNPGTTMHACSTVGASTTLCGLEVAPGTIGVVEGYTAVCQHCFPMTVTPSPRLGPLSIEGRGTTSG